MQKSLKYHRSFAKIDLSAIKENFVALKALIHEKTKTMAIVKANAYGHGAVRVAKVLENMADYFAVADIEEALELRENGIENPFLFFRIPARIIMRSLLRIILFPPFTALTMHASFLSLPLK